MKVHAARLLTACLVLAVLAIALWGLNAAAPEARNPEPTAFGEGPQNVAAWRQSMEESGYQVSAMVSDTALLADAPDGARTLVVMVAPLEAPTEDVVRVLDGHLSRGGSVFILDAEGAYNPWLARYGVAVGGQHLLDTAATAAPSHAALEGGDTASRFAPVAAHNASYLVIDEGLQWQGVLSAPAAMHVDLDGNGSVDAADPSGPHAVGAVLRHQAGGLLMVTADPSFLTDEQWSRPGVENGAFVRWLVRQALPQGGTILADESQHGWTENEAHAVTLVQGMGRLVPWTVALSALAFLAVPVSIAAKRLPKLMPYTNHEMSDPVTPPPSAQDVPRDLHLEMAWQILAARTGQPLARLKETGPAEAAAGLSEDAAVSRALLGESTTADHVPLMQTYLKIKGVEPK